jgi:hypothetical protein
MCRKDLLAEVSFNYLQTKPRYIYCQRCRWYLQVNLPEMYKSASLNGQKLPLPRVPALSNDAKCCATLLSDSEGGMPANWLIVHDIAADKSSFFGTHSLYMLYYGYCLFCTVRHIGYVSVCNCRRDWIPACRIA